MKLIKERIECHWEDLNIFEEVLFVLTVPAEYSEKEKAIMRDCAYKAGLINVKSTDLLQFTTERMLIHLNLFKLELQNHLFFFFFIL